ncbi:MAG: hypothetical protein RLZZ444_157 [Pseudomonadota bacterium]|jgi:hypothetical protein
MPNVAAGDFPTASVEWPSAVRIIRSLYPPIDLFEDIADPADWALLLSAEQKTNPRLMETIGNLDLVAPEHRVGGAGASYLMAPFTHVSTDRPSRFSDGTYGVLYVGDRFEVALMETIHHHERFMRATEEKPGWTSQFREILLSVTADLVDLRHVEAPDLLDRDDYGAAQGFARALRLQQAEGIAYPSQRYEGGDCAALFRPNLASAPRQGRHLDYHWNGQKVDFIRDAGSGAVYRIDRT